MPDTTQAPQQQTDPYAEFGGSATAAAPAPAPLSTAPVDPYAEFGGSAAAEQPTKVNAPNGMPANSMQADASEQTPEGHAAAVAQREAQHPIVTGLGEAAGDVWDTVKSMANPLTSGLAGATTQAYEHIKEAVPLFQTYENARANGKTVMESLGATNAKAQQIHDAQDVVKQRVDEFKKNPTVATTRAVADAAALAATVWSGEQLGAGVESPQETALAAQATKANDAINQLGAGVTHVYNPDTGEIELKNPSLIQKIVKGESAAQPAVQSAIGKRVGATVGEHMVGPNYPEVIKGISDYYSMGGETLLKGNQTIMDLPIRSLKTAETEAYNAMDDAAGFDVKAERESLSNDRYKLTQLGNTEADVAQRGNLIESINDSESRISEAEAKMKAANVDPNLADTLHKQRMAANDFKKVLVKNVSSDGQSVNTTGFLNASKQLRFSKFGDRLEQFFGSKEAADGFMADIEQAQKLGKNAQSWQAFAKIMGKYVAPTASLLGAGYAGYEAATK